MSRLAQWALLGAWMSVLLIAGALLGAHLPVRSDLSAFLPDGRNAQESLLREQLQAGSGSGLMLAALSNAEPADLAAASAAIARQLREDAHILRIENGDETSRTALQGWVIDHRYLLSAQMLPERFTAEGLREALAQRLVDLSSPADVVLKSLLPRDPTGEVLGILDQWSGDKPPRRRHGVWFDRGGTHALLLIETAAPGFDLDAQEAVIDRLQAALQSHNDEHASSIALSLTGPGPFGVDIRERTRSQSILFSSLASLCLATLLLLVFRKAAPVLICGLPLATGILGGALAVWLCFGYMHGITLAFGVTVLGVAIDYPIHFFGHCESDTAPRITIRQIWKTLALGATSTCIAYAAMALSGVDGLAQLGIFTIAGLLSALLAVRFLLPSLITAPRETALPLGSAFRLLDAVPAGFGLGTLLLAAALLGHATLHAPLWQNNLASLSPIPQDLLDRDQQMREAIGAPEPRYQIAVTGQDLQSVLTRSESIGTILQQQVTEGQLGGYDSISRFLPAAATQRQRLAALPEAEMLAERLQQAGEGLPFREGYFAPFLADTAKARTAPLLDLDSLHQSPFASRIDSLLRQRGDGSWVALMPLRDVRQPSVVSAALPGEQVWLMDLKSTSESMIAHYRSSMLFSILLAGIAILLMAFIGLRSVRIGLRVLAPVVTAVACTALAMRLLQGPLNLFHLVSLLLVGGLVLDYALFLNRVESAAQRIRSRNAVVLCALSTLTVFGILALSDIPVLRAIGATVAIGVITGLLLAGLQADRNSGVCQN